MKLQISADLDLPLDAVTQKLAFMGRTGSGKTYAATKLAELMLGAGAQIVALDGVGVWHGLRLGDGAFPIPVLGGLHGDLPLDPGAGAIVADVIIDRGISAVLDVSQMLSAEQTRFAYDFATRFFQRKKAAPGAVHLFLEECQEFVPQNPMKGEERMLHAFERIVKLGRNFGIGVSCISQRVQEVNKKALNQTECLFAFQMTGPQERKAIRAWVGDKGAEVSIDDRLPSLPVGTCVVWSPQWLGVSKQIRIARKRSLDASSTPAVGAAARPTGKLSTIDIAELRARLAELAVTEPASPRSKASGEVNALRTRVAELEQKLAERPAAAPALTPEQGELLRAIRGGVEQALKVLETADQAASEILNRLYDARDEEVERPKQINLRTSSDYPQAFEPLQKAAASAVARRETPKTSGLGRAELALLQVLAQRSTTTAQQLSILSCYSIKSSSFANALGALRSAGLVEGSRDALKATDAGRKRAGKVEPLPTGAALLGYWAAKLGKAERSMLEFVVRARRGVTKEEIGKATNYSLTSSSFANALGKLRTLELVSGRERIEAAGIFFEKGGGRG